MAVKAIRDTFAYEVITDEIKVRRIVKAGSVMLPHYVDWPDEDVEIDAQAVPLIIGKQAVSSVPEAGTVVDPEVEVQTQGERSRRRRA
jgi:hypothetical protein